MTITSQPATDEYRDSWDRIFGGKNEDQQGNAGKDCRNQGGCCGGSSNASDVACKADGASRDEEDLCPAWILTTTQWSESPAV